MPAVPTGPTEIDRKLHLIVLQSSPGQFRNLIALARSIGEGQYEEFSYQRADKTEYSNAGTIRSYVAFARQIGLLGDNLGPMRNKSDITDLESFQQWLSDRVAQYLIDVGCPPAAISETIVGLLASTPPLLPSQENVRARLRNPPSEFDFRLCLKIVARFRPSVLKLVSRRVILMPGVLKE
jgi:hypothetical protein